MQRQRAWLILVFLIGIFSPAAFCQETYVKPDLLNIEKIREKEQLGDSYKISRVYVFLAIQKGGEYEAYVTKDSQDLDGDQKNVTAEPNDLAEYEMLTTFSNDLEIKDDKHICYITALPHFDVLFPDMTNPFESNGIIEIRAKKEEDSDNALAGSKTLPLVDSITGETVGIERYVAFYNKAVTKKEIMKKEGDKEVGTGEFKETIGPAVGSYGFIFMQLEESGE